MAGGLSNTHTLNRARDMTLPEACCLAPYNMCANSNGCGETATVGLA